MLPALQELYRLWIWRNNYTMTQYNKAIRDKIPQIIRDDGRSCNVRQLDDEQFLIELEKKLDEETSEYLQSRSLDELADILQVIYRILELRGSSKQELETIRLKKQDERGGFAENLFLVDTKQDF